MKALFFLYDGYVEWEISTLSYLLHVTNVEIETTALTSEVVHSGQFRVKVDQLIEECQIEDYSILIIPGGNPEPLVNNEKLIKLIQDFDSQNKWIAAICGAPTLLGASDVIRDREYTTSMNIADFPTYFNPTFKSKADVTVSENLITAEGNAYVEFAVAVGKQLGIFKDREDELETVLFFKNQLRG
ncbi:thiJ/PfpI family protein [Bacillus coahuilensis p1.1.43]|uniref:ThiJ/PfpI family protein n=2 Tax=Bacillus coahuilensis TaxID=408580 RepID=A0A147K6T5_9BACI|nr:DJ-1/PfpI family protein [Bacillus coahuilensis]KUP05751.1 thiJ/PfpI family protein [Bacillus coahuilensis p1.1.43]